MRREIGTVVTMTKRGGRLVGEVEQAIRGLDQRPAQSTDVNAAVQSGVNSFHRLAADERDVTLDVGEVTRAMAGARLPVVVAALLANAAATTTVEEEIRVHRAAAGG